jgi:hypothetical protein
VTISVAELETLALEAAGGPEGGLTAAELHGATVGIGAADTSRFELQDLVSLLGADALADAESVSTFVGATLDALHAEDMSFAPLLPEDEVPIPERLSALAAWTQSFLTGLVAGLARRGVGSLGELPDEAQEIVRDFAAIAQIDTEPDEAGEEEADFMQLAEYVKVGVLLIMSLANDAGDDSEE